MPDIQIPKPTLQINFSFSLGQIRNLYLRDAIVKTVEQIDQSILDAQLAEYVPHDALTELTQHGFRGELFFPVPCVLETNPFLLGYYRLLLGFSQKEFYSRHFGLSGFKSMEAKGILSKKNKTKLPGLCGHIIPTVRCLIAGIGINRITPELLDNLTLLTVGPQLRGGANVKKGHEGIIDVFGIIHNIVTHAAIGSTSSKIQIINAAGRKVSIEFAPDPDIVIREEMSPSSIRNIIAIEVKGGTDFSNIHNRVGEAEKSHQKAKNEGYSECWTVVNVDNIDLKMAQRESPSTNRFYRLSFLRSNHSDEYEDFKNRILALTGIKDHGLLF